MRSAHVPAWPALLLALPYTGCASARGIADPRMVVLPVAAHGPAQLDLHIPPMGIVCWLNELGGGGLMSVELERPVGSSQPCETVVGFRNGASGSAADDVPRDGCAVMCFHEPGHYRYTVRGGGSVWQGVIHVAAENRP